jgi:hypothetical protein
MNSSHAAWLNGAAALVAAIAPIATSIPGAPAYVGAIILGLNAALHALLPDAPK